MENEIKNYEAQIRELTRKLGEAEAFKGHFLSNIRNAITNPFTSIVGLSEEIVHSDKEAWKKIIMMAALIHGEAMNLDFQFNNIFCAAEIESGELTAEPVTTDVRELIGRIIRKYELAAKRKGLQISYTYKDINPSMHGGKFITDPKFMELIFINLYDNAIKFSSKNDNINVSIEHNQNNLQLEISDSGKGIDSRNLNAIFDRFKRLDPAINSIESGHGLGLSIIKYLVELLEGEIDVQNLNPSGTGFRIRIPEMTLVDGMEGYSAQGNEFLFVNDEVF